AGDALAVLKGLDDKAWEEKLYSVIGFRNFGPAGPQKAVFNPASFTNFPEGMTVSPNRNPIWMKDLSAITFGIHKNHKKEGNSAGERGSGAAAEAGNANGPNDNATGDKVDLVIWNYKDPRLQSQQIVQENQDKNFSFLAEYRPAENKFIRLADDTVRDVTVAPEQPYAVGRSEVEYERQAHLDGQRYADVYAINMQTGERKLAVKKSRWTYAASPSGTQL